ncbi:MULTISPECIES: flagella synthesis protein FlgN [unclassified Symbiopectobacterium]|uniref:flagella synthesis protein FlgN n=1 Tax=unclassified Symbiopectobacterium TaxID=2794573 RepID=UPI0022265CDA|nr:MULTISPECIES: flagellar export chaperone FlgN [unclassified Symbiopectobacterium]MCW2474394.1 flagellar export chaperone FlgN [Candidatus Symbiopectobacterium sp. NZEC151]MCW2485635.1 flagellar export chaperone FlgN [Candidatus Symbiopectobacterium sp. NZEC127]
MEKLQATLDAVLENLNQLSGILSEEQTLLCAGHINSVALQKVTDIKSATLATVQYLDKNRQEIEVRLQLQAPYEADTELFERWQAIQTLTASLHDMNKHNGMLLNQHINYTNEAIAILKPRHGQSLYGPDGQSAGLVVGGRKINL